MTSPSDKFDSRARSVVEGSRGSGEQIPVILLFRGDAGVRSFRSRSAEVSTLNVRTEGTLLPYVAVEVDAAGLDQLAQQDELVEVWYDEPVHAFLDVAVHKTGANQVWSTLGNRGAGVTVGIADTGVDSDHPDFAGRITFSRDFTDEGSAEDGNGHGTHVASITAGSGAASQGKYVGVASEATIMSARVLSSDGGGRTSWVMAGVEWLAQNGADVINLSLGTDINSDGRDPLSALCNVVVDRGKVVVVAAGNAGPKANTVGSPGASAKAITVGASDDSDGMASFSSRGPTADGRVKPDVVAPGHRITAARGEGTSMGTPENEQYTQASGTSMATPHVTGICALMLHQHPGLSPAEVKAILQNTSLSLGLDENTQGKGRVNALAAVNAVGTPPAPNPTPDPDPAPNPDPAPDPDPDPIPAPPPKPTPPPKPSPAPGCLGAVLQMLGLLR